MQRNESALKDEGCMVFGKHWDMKNVVVVNIRTTRTAIQRFQL